MTLIMRTTRILANHENTRGVRRRLTVLAMCALVVVAVALLLLQNRRAAERRRSEYAIMTYGAKASVQSVSTREGIRALEFLPAPVRRSFKKVGSDPEPGSLQDSMMYINTSAQCPDRWFLIWYSVESDTFFVVRSGQRYRSDVDQIRDLLMACDHDTYAYRK